MTTDMKIFEVSRKNFFQYSLLAIIIFFMVIVSIANIILLIFGVILLFFNLLLIITLFYQKNNPPIIITDEKIIISQGPFRNIFEISLKKVKKIEKRSRNKYIIGYLDENNELIWKSIPLFLLDDQDRLEVYNYINEKII